MHDHSNTGETSREALILACCDTVKAVAWSFVRSASVLVEADELYSIGMLAVCEAAGRGLAADNPVAYLVQCAKNAICDEWRRVHGWSTVSLDKPLTDDSSLTLHDLLSVPAAPASSTPSKHTQALNGALRRLQSRKQRAVLRRRYGLPGYGRHSEKEAAAALRTTVKTVNLAAFSGRRKLATDVRLCMVLGLEVAR